jgi:hypothetical protein
MVERHTKKAALRKLQEAAESEDRLALYEHDGRKRETLPRPKTEKAVIKANQQALSVIDASVKDDNTLDNRAMVLYNTSSWVNLLFDRWTTLSDDPSPSPRQNPYDDTAKLKFEDTEHRPTKGQTPGGAKPPTHLNRSSLEDFKADDELRHLRSIVPDSALPPQLSKSPKTDAQNRASNHSSPNEDVFFKPPDIKPSAYSSSDDDPNESHDTGKERNKERDERRKARERTSLNSLSYDDLYGYTAHRRKRGRERERPRPQSPPSAKSRSTHIKSHTTNKANSSRAFEEPLSQERPPSDAVPGKTYAPHDTLADMNRPKPVKEKKVDERPPETEAQRAKRLRKEGRRELHVSWASENQPTQITRVGQSREMLGRDQ